MTIKLRPTTTRNHLARDPKTAPEVFAYSVVVNGDWWGAISGYPYANDQQAAALKAAKNHATQGYEDDYDWTTDTDGVVHGTRRR